MYDGVVQICHNGYWGSVCGYRWDNIDASVACRQLGFSPIGKYAAILTARSFWFSHVISGAIGGTGRSSSSNAPIVLDEVSCSGSEAHLTDCGHAGLGVHHCSSSIGEAFVLCTGIWHMMMISSIIVTYIPHHL